MQASLLKAPQKQCTIPEILRHITRIVDKQTEWVKTDLDRELVKLDRMIGTRVVRPDIDRYLAYLLESDPSCISNPYLGLDHRTYLLQTIYSSLAKS